jgi:hypothetical protein
MATTVTVSCSHPSGLIMEDGSGNRVILKGAGLTIVDLVIWTSVSNYHANSRVIQNGVVKQVS